MDEFKKVNHALVPQNEVQLANSARRIAGVIWDNQFKQAEHADELALALYLTAKTLAESRGLI